MQMNQDPAHAPPDVLPTRILMDEHRVIERVLACLEILADQCERNGKLEHGPALQALDFIRDFADAAHHGKEEARLFPAMEAHGLPAHVGPTAVMRSEHDRGREYVRVMAGAEAEAARGGELGAARFVAAARSFVLLLREHIAKEDQVLFPMADGMIPPDGQRELLEAFRHVHESELPTGSVDRCLRIADELCQRYGVDESTLPAGGAGCLGSCPGQA